MVKKIASAPEYAPKAMAVWCPATRQSGLPAIPGRSGVGGSTDALAVPVVDA